MNSIGYSKTKKFIKSLGALLHAWVIVGALISCYNKAWIIFISFNPFLDWTGISCTFVVVSANIITISLKNIFYFPATRADANVWNSSTLTGMSCFFSFGFSNLVCFFRTNRYFCVFFLVTRVWKDVIMLRKCCSCSLPGMWAVLHHLLPILSPLEPIVKHFNVRPCLECNSLFNFLLFFLYLSFLKKEKKNRFSLEWLVISILIHLKSLRFKS